MTLESAHKPQTPQDASEYLQKISVKHRPFRYHKQRAAPGIWSITTGSTFRDSWRPAQETEIRFAGRHARRLFHQNPGLLKKIVDGSIRPTETLSNGREAVIFKVMLQSGKRKRPYAIKIAFPTTNPKLDNARVACTSQLDAMSAMRFTRRQYRDSSILLPIISTDRVMISPWKNNTLTLPALFSFYKRQDAPNIQPRYRKQLSHLMEQPDFLNFLMDITVATLVPRINMPQQLKKDLKLNKFQMIHPNDNIHFKDIVAKQNVGIHIPKLQALYALWRGTPEMHHTHQARYDAMNFYQAIADAKRPHAEYLTRYAKKMNKPRRIFIDQVRNATILFEVTYEDITSPPR